MDIEKYNYISDVPITLFELETTMTFFYFDTVNFVIGSFYTYSTVVDIITHKLQVYF